MRVAVVGLGGVGGYIASMLAKSGVCVVGFARGEHLKKIQNDSLKIVEDKETWHVDIDARVLDEADGYFDVVLFCVKSYDLTTSYKQISSHIDKDSILVSFSNGVSNGDILRELSDSVVLDGCVYILSHIQEAGVIRKKGKVFAAVFGGDKKATDTLLSIFEKANLRTKTPDDIKTAIWKKYIFISAFATLTSYYDKSMGYIYEHYKDEAKKLLCEIADIAHAKGIDIYDEVEKSLSVVSKVPYDSSTSMHLDFQNNKKTELETLSGYIVKEGKRLGVKTPVMKKMYDKLLA
jgi:2-dehydropantoate 2-reductase